MTLKQILYLGLSIIGLIIPWYYNFQFMNNTGAGLLSFPLSDFIRDGFANSAASSLTTDLLIGASAATLFIIIEGRRLRMKYWWVYLILTNLIAFAFAFPLFLFMRERKLEVLRTTT